MAQRTLGVVGGGIVGIAIARELARRHPDDQVLVLEKEPELARHQTGHNSGVVHAGIYYKPGSLKAQLCTRGRSLLSEYAAEHALPYDECGKLVVAVEAGELGRLDALEQTARANGVPGLLRLDPAGIADVEPHAAGLAALHSPATAITDYPAITRALAADVEEAGGRVVLDAEVTGLTRRAGRIEVVCRTGFALTERFVVDELVICGGLYADRLARLAGGDPTPRIIPFRGEYLRVQAAKQDLVRGMVYPVPDPRYPFLGVHFTRRVEGTLEVGPNAVLGLAREGYRRGDVRLDDLREIAGWPGMWQVARAHWRTGVREVWGSLSVRAYMQVASQYVPAITTADVVRRGAGVRAQAVDRDGTLVDDFRIDSSDGITVVRNAPSPAATSSLAIAEWVVDRLADSHPGSGG